MLGASKGADPSKTVTGSVTNVYVRLVGFTYNVQIRSDRLADVTGWSDPLTSAHNGESSVYYGGPSHLLGFDAGHVAAGVGDDANNPGLEAHYDTFGPLNPLHWFLEYPLPQSAPPNCIGHKVTVIVYDLGRHKYLEGKHVVIYPFGT